MGTLSRHVLGLALLCFLAQSLTTVNANTIDSLFLELEKVAEYITRIKLLGDLSYELVYQNLDESILISKGSLILSEKIDHKFYAVSSSITIGRLITKAI